MPVSYRSCTDEDKKHFASLSDLNSRAVNDVWQHLYCLDDPTQVKFQGGLHLVKEQTLRLKVLSCQLSNIDCVAQSAAVDDYLKNLAFVTVFND